MAPPGATQRAASKFIVFENFEKMNTQSIRQALSEKELAWLENLQPIAGNNLTTVPGPATALATIGATTLSMFYAFLNGIDYEITFTTNGAAYATNLATGAVNNFAPPGTFTNPDLTTWQGVRVLINDPTAGYSTWDGTAFVKQGSISPVFTVTNGGGGYSSVPAVTISGGSGTGATAHAVVTGGVVTSVVLDTPGVGYKAGDTITVSFGGGVGAGAAGHVTMTGFNIDAITITSNGAFNMGAGGPGVFALAFTGGGGAGAAGTANVTLSGSLLIVANISLTAGGSGYTSVPTVSLPGVTGGAPPTFQAFLGTEAVATIVKDASGSGYVSAPTVGISGGVGVGFVNATAHATLTGSPSGVTTLVLDTPGAGYSATPAVVIGTGTAATAAGHIWPFVPKGTTLAVFGGRVWLNGLANGNYNLLQYTGTQGFDDFAAANASGSLVISDTDLVHQITALRNYNNYLWIMGDQSVKQIGNISLNATGTVTLFTILTLSSDQGTIYPSSCASFNRVFMFANSNGVYAVFGSSVQKISDDMDGIFKLVDFSQAPSAALADINNIHNIMFLVRYRDPLSTTRSLLLTFTGKKWFVISQGDSLKAICTTSALSTGKIAPYGSSGTDVTNLLNSPTTRVAFKIQSSLTHHGNAVQRKKTIRQGYALTASGAAVAGSLTGTVGSITVSMDSDEGSQSDSRSLVAGFQTRTFSDPNVSGTFLGITITGTLAAFTMSAMRLEYQETNIGNQR